MQHPQKTKEQYWPALVAVAALAGAEVSRAIAADPSPPAVISDIDLSKPFATHAPWRFTATQEPPVVDPFFGEGEVPGPIKLCLRASPAALCNSQLRSTLPPSFSSDLFASLHYLEKVEIVRPQGAADHRLLLVQAATLHSADNHHLKFTQVLAYRQSQDSFVRIYERLTGSNNNQETRYIATGPLIGDIISVEPTSKAPFGFWVSVSALTLHDTYREALRYRSATRYSDGNRLAVIDSEMPNIEQRLGVWRPGSPLPLPAGPCPKPHLIRMELWCS